MPPFCVLQYFLKRLWQELVKGDEAKQNRLAGIREREYFAQTSVQGISLFAFDNKTDTERKKRASRKRETSLNEKIFGFGFSMVYLQPNTMG